MFRRTASGEEKALADRLRREALAARPEYSETLHARIGRAVRQRQAAEVPVRRRPAALRLLPHGALATVAAIGVFSAVLIAWQVIDRFGESDTAGGDAVAERVDERTDAPVELEVLAGLPDRAAEGIDALVASTMVQQRWAYLDHDARLAAQMLLDQLPFDVLSVIEPGPAASPAADNLTSPPGFSL